jgi:uncharacterized membrane protein
MNRAVGFIEKYGIFVLIALFALIYASWSVNRHNRFQTDAVDLAIFDQPLWRLSRLEPPLSTIKFNTYPGENLFGDHFHPIIIPLAFLFRIWDDVQIVLVAQSVLAVLSVYPIYLLAKRRTSSLFTLSLSFAYLSFIGFQTAIDYDFHEVTAGVGIVAWAIYFLETGKLKLFYFFMVLGFLLKEDVPLIFTGLGILLLVQYRKYRHGVFTIFCTLGYYYIVTSYIIPYFKHDRFAYEELDPVIGKTTTDLFVKALTDPLLVIKTFFLPPVKFKTMLNLVGSFAFLPLVAPLTLIPIIPNFISRFLTGLGQRWLIRYQYNIILTPIFALGAVCGFVFLNSLLKRLGKDSWVPKLNLFFSFLLVLAPVIQTARTNSPFTRILNPVSYAADSRFSLEYFLLAQIPKDPTVSVMAQSTFVPHLSHRFEIYRFEDWVVKAKKPKYVIMSADEGSDPPYGREVLLEKILNLSRDPSYDILYFDGIRLLMKLKGV